MISVFHKAFHAVFLRRNRVHSLCSRCDTFALRGLGLIDLHRSTLVKIALQRDVAEKGFKLKTAEDLEELRAISSESDYWRALGN